MKTLVCQVSAVPSSCHSSLQQASLSFYRARGDISQPGCPGGSLGQRSPFILIFVNLLFYIGIQLINDVVTVSGGQQSDSAIHTPVSILPQTPLPSELPHGIEQS